MSDLQKIKEMVRNFNLERNLDKYHNPKDLVIALVSEVGELAECYRWLSQEEISSIHQNPLKKKKIEEEIADVLMYLIIISYKTDIDLISAVEAKLEKNRKKYPVEKIKSIHTNPLEGYKSDF